MDQAAETRVRKEDISDKTDLPDIVATQPSENRAASPASAIVSVVLASRRH
jgi:hypothetical protein